MIPALDNQKVLEKYHNDFNAYLERENKTEIGQTVFYGNILYNPKINSREGIERFTQWMVDQYGINKNPFPLYHTFGGGTYTREIHLPKGYAVVGEIHRQESMVYVLKGSLIVADENETRKIDAPTQFVCKGGIRRIAYILEDTIWIDIHATDKETVEEAESEIFADSYSELYSDMVESIGFTESKVREISEQDFIETPIENIEIRDSYIEGKGVFVTKDFNQGELIGIARINNDRTLIGRYANHSHAPNAEFIIKDNTAICKALRNIQSNEEITVDYRNATQRATELNENLQCLE